MAADGVVKTINATVILLPRRQCEYCHEAILLPRDQRQCVYCPEANRIITIGGTKYYGFLFKCLVTSETEYWVSPTIREWEPIAKSLCPFSSTVLK